ncbi:hypothetical protein Dimus_034659 [Dionaea muscipula]
MLSDLLLTPDCCLDACQFPQCPLHSHHLSLDGVSLISSLIFEVRKKLLVAHHIYGFGQPFVYRLGV